jgi:phosphoenolpyruvate carboxylase
MDRGAFMRPTDTELRTFQEEVALKYQLYNGLFLTLPFEGMTDTGTQLPLFAAFCKAQLAKGASPRAIVDEFLEGHLGKRDPADKIRTLFLFLQFVERQVVLFDALEDAAFDRVHDIDGAGSLSHLLKRVQEAGAEARLKEELQNYKVRIVLTAHPTQFYPQPILGIISELGDALRRNALQEIHELLKQMGKTRFQNRTRPSPLEEARRLIWRLENVFYRSLPEIQARLVAALPEGERDPFALGPKVELGFWPGGDRDGNPFVTVEVTLAVARQLKASILRLYLADLQLLRRRLTFDGVSDQLAVIEARLRATSGENAPGESDVGRPGGMVPYAAADDLLADLRRVREDLLARHGGLFLDRLDLLLHKIQIFGFHFASMDLRQDSRVLSRALRAVLAATCGHWSARSAWVAGHYDEATEEERVAFLEKLLLRRRVPPVPEGLALDPVTADALACFPVARAIQAENGERGLHRFIVSNCRGPLDVLEVFALATLSGWPPEQFHLDVVPLFEMIEDIEQAAETLGALYPHPLYAAHLKRRGSRQTVMLGFSDGTKDGGYVTANWVIHQAKERLTSVSRRFGIQVVFFDGRGGPPGRGGGNTHKFYRSLGPRIEARELQVTIQGQTISSNFGTTASARYNIEQLFTAGLEPKLFPPSEPDFRPEDSQLFDRLSQAAAEAYRRLKTDPSFLAYLEEVTPLRYYEHLTIASRPTRREGASVLRFEDLRAIPFVGAWTQMRQNVPGFYGFGSALRRLFDEGRKNDLCQLCRRSLFFRTLVENAMMSLSKSNFSLTRYLQDDPRFGPISKLIEDEATLSRDLLRELTGEEKLLETAPALRESIRIREQLILPLLVIQHAAMAVLRELEAHPSAQPPQALETYRKMVVKAMAASINAARNAA